METTSAAAAGATPRLSPRAAAVLAVVALLGGAGVALLSVLGPARQALLVLALVAGLPGLLLVLTRPHLAVATYLFLLPLVMTPPLAAGLNGGEILTAAMVVLGTFSLWDSRERLGTAWAALRPILWPLLGLAVVSIFSLIANEIGTLGEIVSAIFKFVAFGGAAILVHMHTDTPAKLRVVLHGAMAGALGVAVYAIIAYVLGWSYSETYDWNRASGTFEHWNQLGGFMVLMSVPTLGLAAVTRRISLRLALGLAFILEIIALLLSLTLGSIVALAAGGLFGLIFLARIGWRRVMAMSTLAVIAFATVYLTNPLFQEKLTRFPERTLDRLRTYLVGIAMFRDRFLLGFGSQENLLDELWFGEAGYGLTALGAASSVPHNAFLLMGVEKGVLGVIFLLLIVGGALWILYRSRHALMTSSRSLLYQGIVVGVAGFLVQNMTNNLVLHARIGIIFFALVALVDRMARVEGAEP